jgi:hypothetical protein
MNNRLAFLKKEVESKKELDLVRSTIIASNNKKPTATSLLTDFKNSTLKAPPLPSSSSTKLISLSAEMKSKNITSTTQTGRRERETIVFENDDEETAIVDIRPQVVSTKTAPPAAVKKMLMATNAIPPEVSTTNDGKVKTVNQQKVKQQQPAPPPPPPPSNFTAPKPVADDTQGRTYSLLS